MRKIIAIILCFINVGFYSQMSVPDIQSPDLKLELSNIPPRKHKMDISNNVGMVVGGLAFMTAGYLGERYNTKNNGFQGIAKVVSPGKIAIVVGGGFAIIGLTIRM